MMPGPSTFRPRTPHWLIGAALLSGLLQYLASGLEPWLGAAWLAPIPLLLAAFRASTREAWALAVIAGVIGGASTAGYYAMFIGLLGSGLVMVLRGLVSGIVVARTRAVVLASRRWPVVFVYPALMAGFDTIVATLSRDGTMGSLAYSQMAAVPVIQIAALAGASGIVFIVSLFGALAAIALHRRGDVDKPRLAYGLPIALILAGLVYGFLRIAGGPAPAVLPVGLMAIDRSAPPTKSTGADDAVWGAYAAAIPGLVRAGVKVVVLPEKIARLDREAADRVRALLGHVASDNAVYVLAGVAIGERDHQENRAWLFAPTGKLIADYAKHHLVPGLEARFTSGTDLLVRRVETSRVGIAICKDMDFPTLGRRYALLGVDALLVPAWDFDQDALWHARMAILRGVESDFAVVRSARQGLLTVSDRYGRIVDVTASGSAPVATLTALAPLGSGAATVYARLGDAFGWLCAISSAAAWLVSLRTRRSRRTNGTSRSSGPEC
jgi:apolipoprotein N-acyltransferase